MAPRQKSSGGDRTRTDDFQLAKLALSQLSYAPPALKARGQTSEISNYPDPLFPVSVRGSWPLTPGL